MGWGVIQQGESAGAYHITDVSSNPNVKRKEPVMGSSSGIFLFTYVRCTAQVNKREGALVTASCGKGWRGRGGMHKLWGSSQRDALKLLLPPLLCAVFCLWATLHCSLA